MKKKRLFVVLISVVILLSGCYKPGPGAKTWQVSGVDNDENQHLPGTPTSVQSSNELRLTEKPVATPTPNQPVILPTPRANSFEYVVQPGDTLRDIGQQYQVSVARLSAVNNLSNANLIDVGQVLVIPPPTFDAVAPAFKIIPDSELVYSPSNAYFDIEAFIHSKDGYLGDYYGTVSGSQLSGAEIVARVATEYSLNPRLLLALLEYQSGWVTESDPSEETRVYPMGYYASYWEGLYTQLTWAANLLNEGYYLWKVQAISAWILSDSIVIEVEPTINAGTAGVLNLMRHLASSDNWHQAVSEEGVFSTYLRLFGYPFDYALEPLISDDLTQPELQLPFEDGVVWSFTGGPHGGWGSGSAWAAIDFAPPGNALGCVESEAWVTASAPGEIVYSDDGAVVQDLDGDGVWQTGWSLLYMHIETADRVQVGDILKAGDRVGHPSCEGGFSTGTHLHIARRYNGEWISADGDLPFVMDGWQSAGYGSEYNGYLVKGEQTVEAWNGRSPYNAIKR